MRPKMGNATATERNPEFQDELTQVYDADRKSTRLNSSH